MTTHNNENIDVRESKNIIMMTDTAAKGTK